MCLGGREDYSKLLLCAWTVSHECISSSHNQYHGMHEKKQDLHGQKETGFSGDSDEGADTFLGVNTQTHIPHLGKGLLPLSLRSETRVKTCPFCFAGAKGTRCISTPKVFQPVWGVSSVPCKMRSQTCKGTRMCTRVSLWKWQILESIHLIFETESHSVARMILNFPISAPASWPLGWQTCNTTLHWFKNLPGTKVLQQTNLVTC